MSNRRVQPAGSPVARQSDLAEIRSQQAVFNYALVSLAEDLEAISDALVDAGIIALPDGEQAEDDDEPEPEYQVDDGYPEGYVPDVENGGETIEPPDEEWLRQRREEARRRVREQAELANESTLEEIAAADDDPNAIADVPEEGIPVEVKGRPLQRPLGDIRPVE